MAAKARNEAAVLTEILERPGIFQSGRELNEPAWPRRACLKSSDKKVTTVTGKELEVLDLIKEHAWVRRLRRHRGLNFYLSERGAGLHYGRFSSFEEARQWLCSSKEFDHPEFVEEYAEVRTARVFSFDYPVMFWLRKAFDEGANSVFDIGGSVGIHYYAYQRFVDYPAELTWDVYELPASVARGREFAKGQGVSQLSFSETLATDTIQADIWMAAGAIEFIEHTRLDALLSAARKRPRHIFLNKIPLYDGDDYVSTQNLGNGAFAPHYVYNRPQYVVDIENVGYQLADSWEVPDRSFSVPGAPEESFSPYSGLYFRAV